jgi:hypothetical protein
MDKDLFDFKLDLSVSKYIHVDEGTRRLRRTVSASKINKQMQIFHLS